MKKVVIVGAGLGGLSAACFLAQKGFDVTVIEKNDQAGGRATIYEENGFKFDLGPSWYWMPEIFESLFKKLGHNREDFFELKKLDPSYRIYWDKDDFIDMPANIGEVYELFDEIEHGAGKKLEKILQNSKVIYDLAINKLLYKYHSNLADMLTPEIIKETVKNQLYVSLEKLIRKNFKSFRLEQLTTWQSLFLGASPQNTPAFYSFMLYADFVLNTWYPIGGIHEFPKALYEIAQKLGVKFQFEEPVKSLEFNEKTKKVTKVITDKSEYETDYALMNCDYHFVETRLLPEQYRTYDESYWDKKTVAPSCLLFYIGINKKLSKIKHHNFFFENKENWDQHFDSLFNNQDWPGERPTFYFSSTSVTDSSTAPEGHENIFVLIPIAADLDDTEEIREKYFNYTVQKMEYLLGEKFAKNIIVKKIVGPSEQKSVYNSFKGTCFGLAQTLTQSVFMRPNQKSKKVKNIYYAGHFTHPGIGIPMVPISAEIASQLIEEDHEKK